MPAAVTSKGQVTIPKSIRERLGLAAGDAVRFDLDPDGRVVLTRVEGAPAHRIAGLRGVAGFSSTTSHTPTSRSGLNGPRMSTPS